MSRRFSSRERPPRQVRFQEPAREPLDRPLPPSILRPPSTEQRLHAQQPGSPSQPVRRSSLPDMRHPEEYLNKRRLRALEALHDLRSYLKEACNFHTGDSWRALFVPSIDGLCALVSFLNTLRGNVDDSVTKRPEAVLRSMSLDTSARHPHEQLALPDRAYTDVHERNARRARRKRARREAEFRLMEFVSRQLKLTLRVIRSLTPAQREQRELDAFKSRLVRFYAPRVGTVTAPSSPHSGYSSVPQSPVGRPLTGPRSPYTDPQQHARAMEMPGAETVDELFPPMENLNLPSSSFDAGLTLGPSVSSLGPSPPSAPQPLQQSSPYGETRASPYASPYGGTRTSPHASPYASPSQPAYGSAMTTGHPPHTPPQVYASYPAANRAYAPTPPQAYAVTPPQAYAVTPPQAYATTPPQAYAATPPQAYAATAPSPAYQYPFTPPQAPLSYPVQAVHLPGAHSPYYHAGPTPMPWPPAWPSGQVGHAQYGAPHDGAAASHGHNRKASSSPQQGPQGQPTHPAPQ